MKWDEGIWDEMKWNRMKWDEMKWNRMKLDRMEWNGLRIGCQQKWSSYKQLRCCTDDDLIPRTYSYVRTHTRMLFELVMIGGEFSSRITALCSTVQCSAVQRSVGRHLGSILFLYSRLSFVTWPSMHSLPIYLYVPLIKYSALLCSFVFSFPFIITPVLLCHVLGINYRVFTLKGKCMARSCTTVRLGKSTLPLRRVE